MNQIGRIKVLLLVSVLLWNQAIAQLTTIRGSVLDSDAKRGISNVAVTDGYSIVVTDKKGNYKLAANEKAEFVYITVPAGYKIPEDNNLPQYYARISKSKEKYNFHLQKEAVDDSKHILIVGADPQPSNAEAGKKWLDFASKEFDIINKKYANMPRVGILCGDIVGDDLSLFDNHKTAVAKMGFPVFQVVGNHDLDFDARSNEGSAKTFKDYFGPEYYSFNKGKIHYVVLNDVFYLGRKSSYVAYINDQQMAWLEKDLALIPAGTTVVVSMHISPEYDGVAPSSDANQKLPGDNVVRNAKHLYKLLKPYKAHIMSGHTHWNQKFEKDGIFHHVHGAICGAWWGGNTSFDGTPLGYGVYEVDGDNISWYFQSAGKDEKYQMDLTFSDSSNTVIANVWNWDHAWKVELIADGQSMGQMERFIGESPVMRAYYESLPAEHTWMKPVPTAHLFRTKIADTVKNVEVKVTDRFGNLYFEKLSISRN